MKIRHYILAFCFILSTYPSFAQWTKTNGPSEVNAVVIEKYNNKLFLGTRQSGIFKSVNNAASWTPVSSFPDSAAISGISKIIDHNDTLFVSVFNSIYKSDDSGATWKYANTGIPDTMYSYNLYEANSTLYATAYALDWLTSALFTRVYAYNDGTMQWSELPNLPADVEVKSIVALHDTVFFAAPGHGILKTHNAGTNWDSVNAVLGSINTNNVTLLACNGLVLYAIGEAGGTELLSSANGINWASSTVNALGFNPVNTFAVSHDTLLLGSAGALTASYDGGNNWSLYSVPFYYDFDDIKFIGNSVYGSDVNSGVNVSSNISDWSFANTGLPFATPIHLANPFSNLYALDYFSTFHSANSGNSWSIDSTITWNMHAMARMGNKLMGFVAASQSNLVSWNQGQSWLYDTGTGPSIVVSDALVDNTNHKLYAWGQNDVRRSDDYGGSWHSLFFPNGNYSDTVFTSLTRIKNRLFLTILDTGNKLLYSDDFGAHWTLNTAVSGVSLAVAVDTMLVISSNSGIKSSADLGNSFINSLSTIPMINTFVNGRSLFSYGAPLPNNIFYSPDYGTSWLDISDTDVTGITSLEMDNTYLYAGTQANAVWRNPLSTLGITYTPDTSNNYVLPNSVNNILYTGNNQMTLFPNPFSSQLQIGLTMQDNHYVDLRLYDAMGRCIQLIAQSNYPSGKHNFTFSKDIPAGVYFIVAHIDGEILSGKIIKQ